MESIIVVSEVVFSATGPVVQSVVCSAPVTISAYTEPGWSEREYPAGESPLHVVDVFATYRVSVPQNSEPVTVSFV